MNRSGDDNNGGDSSFAAIAAVDDECCSFVATARAKQTSFSVDEILIQSRRAASVARRGLLNAWPGPNRSALTTSRSRDAQRAGDRVEGLRIDPVLLFEDARRKGAGVVARENRHPRLGEDRAGVDLGRNEMNRAAVLGEPLGERALVGVEAAQVRQQRGMNVEQPSSPSLDEGGAQHPHEPGEADDVDRGGDEVALWSAASNAGLPG